MSESYRKHLNILMSRLHPKPNKSEPLDTGPRHQNFLNVPISYNVQPRLRSLALKPVCLTTMLCCFSIYRDLCLEQRKNKYKPFFQTFNINKHWLRTHWAPCGLQGLVHVSMSVCGRELAILQKQGAPNRVGNRIRMLRRDSWRLEPFQQVYWLTRSWKEGKDLR